MVSKKLKKAQAKVEQLTAEASQLRLSILNIRQMYEGCVGEKQQLTNQLGSANRLLVAAVAGSRGKSITVKAKVFETLDTFAGVDTKEADGDLVLTALTVAEVEAMQEEIDEDTA